MARDSKGITVLPATHTRTIGYLPLLTVTCWGSRSVNKLAF